MNKPSIDFRNGIDQFRSYIAADLDAANMFQKYFSAGKMGELVEFMENHFNEYPLFREFLIQVYDQAMELGLSELAKEAARIYVEVTTKISDVGIKNLGLPLIFKDLTMKKSFNDLVEQSAYTKLAKSLGHIQTKPIVINPDPILQENKAFYPYFEKSFEIIDEKTDKTFFIDSQQLSPFSSLFYKYSETQYGHSSNFFSDCHLDLLKSKVDPTPFILEDITVSKALKYLKKFGLNHSDEFIVVDFDNNEQFYPAPLTAERYIPSLNYFIDLGIKVIRIGKKNSIPIFDKLGFIDLTFENKPSEVNIYLCGKAKFYFGYPTSSYSLASSFGTPCCLMSFLPYGSARKNDFVQNIKFKEKATNEKLTFKIITNMGLFGASRLKNFVARGLTPDLPNADDNLRLATEMIEYLEKGTIYNKNRSFRKKNIKTGIHGGFCSNSLRLYEDLNI